MSLFTNMCNQKAVYWAVSSTDGFNKKTFSTAVEKNVRWEDKTEIFINSEGKEEKSKAIIYCDFDVEIGDYLHLGQLDDLSTAEKTDPMQVLTAHPVKAKSKTPNIQATEFLRKIWL